MGHGHGVRPLRAPTHPPFYEEVLFDEQKRVAIITVAQGTAKPYVLRHNGREEIYVRVGSTSRLATPEQQARLFASGGLLHAEVMPVSGTGLADLSAERLSDYLANRVGDQELPSSASAWEQRLEGLSMMTPQPGTAPLCSIAGLALFGHNPRRGLPQSGIRWMAISMETARSTVRATTRSSKAPWSLCLEGQPEKGERSWSLD